MGARKRVGIGWWYRPARLYLAELISWNRFLEIVFGPQWHSPNGSMTFHSAQKVCISRAQPPSHLPS
jgi:hypothetical protein